jgi:LAS superfamily LD-carboxypeptidase LdcB
MDTTRYPSGPQAAPQGASEAVFNTALQKLIAASGGKIKVGSGKRTRAQQEKLYREKPHLAAKPGHSKHETGTAADLVFADDAARAFAHANAAQFGLRFPMLTRAPGKKFEPWHIEL